MSLEPHSALVEQLKPLMMEPNFSILFDQLTAGESNSTRFLLKMELKRLATPCTRIIDLHDKTSLPIEMVKYGQQRHFLDAPAHASFKEALELYNGEFTFGVYEHVIQAHTTRIAMSRVTESYDTHSDNEYLAQGISLGCYFSRSEERMNYTIQLAAEKDNLSIAGVSVDLSVNGAKIRLPNGHPFTAGSTIIIKFTELSREFDYQDLHDGVEYEIIEVSSHNEYSWLRLKRIGGSEALSDLLAKLINAYKYRYKVDVKDVVMTTQGLGFERHYLSHLPHLPLFVISKDKLYNVNNALLSQDNLAIYHYFDDENKINQLSAMLTNTRLQRLLAPNEERTSEHSIFFCFTFQTQGVKYFYSATLFELKAQQLQALFFHYGASRSSWKIFKAYPSIIDHKMSYTASILPGQKGQYAPLVEEQVSQLSHLIQLTELTNKTASKHYAQWEIKPQQTVNDLKIFGHNKMMTESIKPITLQFRERRSEARFSLKTLVLLKQGDISVTGFTRDISSQGLQVYLDAPANFDKQKPVLLGFPKLQHLSNKTSLLSLPYKLVEVQATGLSLHFSASIVSPHNGVQFFHRLINYNREKFAKLSEPFGRVNELADAMKNLTMRNLISLPYFVERTVKSATISSIGIAKHEQGLARLFKQAKNDNKPDAVAVDEYDLSPLLENHVFKRYFIDPIKQMKPKDGFDYFEIFIAISQPSSKLKPRLICLPTDEIGDSSKQMEFIKHSQAKGQFLALRVYRAATPKPEFDYIKRELKYIHTHSLNRGKKLEEQLWNIIGVGELLDITEEVLLRFSNPLSGK